MSYPIFNGLRIAPDKPGPNHAETLRVQRDHKPHVFVRLACPSFACDTVTDFEWTSWIDIESYKNGLLSCPKCGEAYPKQKITRKSFYDGFPIRFKSYNRYPIKCFWPKKRKAEPVKKSSKPVETNDGWIKLDGCLLKYPYPDPGKEVLVTVDDGVGHRKVLVAFHDFDEWWNPSGTPLNPSGTPFSQHCWMITHWRYFPPPAKS